MTSALHTPGEQIVQANGVALCVETFGDPADPMILLIHGAGNSMLSWDEELCERLALEDHASGLPATACWSRAHARTSPR